MVKADFFYAIYFFVIMMIGDYFEKAQKLHKRRWCDSFSFPDAVDDECLMAFLFGEHVYNKTGFAELDGAKDDGAGLVEHRGKDRENVRT